MYRQSVQAHRAKKPPLPISELVKECDREQTKNTRVSRPFKQPRAALPAYPGEGILSSRQAPRSLSFGGDGGKSSRFDGHTSLEESAADDGSCRAEKREEERPQDRKGEKRRTPRSARSRSLFGADEPSEEDAPGEDELRQRGLPRRSNESEMVTQRFKEGEEENKKRMGGKKGDRTTHSHSGRGREDREDYSEDGDRSPRLLGRHFSTFSSEPCTDTRKATSTVGTDPSSSSSSLSSAAPFSSSSGSGTVTSCLAPSWLLSTLGVSPNPTAGSSSSSSSAASLAVPRVSSRTSGDRGPTTPSEQSERGEKRVSFSRGGSDNGRRGDSGAETVARGRARVKSSEERPDADPGERDERVREQEREKRRAARDKSAPRRRGRHERRSERKEGAGETTEESSEGDACFGGRRETKKRRFLDRSGERDAPTSAGETEAEEKRVACRGQAPRRAARSASGGREKKREGEKTRRTPDERKEARRDEEVSDGGRAKLENRSVSEFAKKHERRSRDREKTRQDRKDSRHGSKRKPSEKKTDSSASFLGAPSVLLYPPSTLFGSTRHSSTLLPSHASRPFGAPNFSSSLVPGRSESLSASAGLLSRLPLEAALSSVSCGGDTRGGGEVANGDSERERDASCGVQTLEREAAELSANKPRSPPLSLGALLQVSSRLAMREGKKEEGSREEGSGEREQTTEASTDSVENAERSEGRGAETEGEEAVPESKSELEEDVEAGASDSFFGGEAEDRDGDETGEKKDPQDACATGELWAERKRKNKRTARRCSVGIQCESVDSARGKKETETPFPSLLQEEESEREKERQQFLRFCQQLHPSASPSLLFNDVPSASTHSRPTCFPVSDARDPKEFSVEKNEEVLSPSLPGSPRTLRDRPLRHFAPLAFNSSASHPRLLVCSDPLEMEASSPCSSSKHPCSSSSPFSSSGFAASSSFQPLECVSSFGTAPGALFGEEEERVLTSFLGASETAPSPSQPASLCASRSRQSVREKEDGKQESFLEAEREKAAALWRLEELKQLGRQVSLWGERRLLSGSFFGGEEGRTELLHHLGVQLEEEGVSDPEEDDEEDFQESVQQQLLFFQRMQREQPSLFPHTLAKQREEARRAETKGGEGQGETTSEAPSASLASGGKKSGGSRDLSGKEKEDDACSVHSDSTVCLPPYFYVALSPAGGSPGKSLQTETLSRSRGDVDRGPVSLSSFDSKVALQGEEGELHARGSGENKDERTGEDTRDGAQGEDKRRELSSEDAFVLQRRHEMHLWRRLLEGEEERADVSQAATCALLRRTRRARVSAPAGVAVECWQHRDLTLRAESEEKEEQGEDSKDSELLRSDAELCSVREEAEEGNGEGSCEEEDRGDGQAETETGHARVVREVDAVGDWNEEEREKALEEAAELQAESLDLRFSLPVAESPPCIDHESAEETEHRDRGEDDSLSGDDEGGGAARRWLSLSSGRDNTEPQKPRGECDGSDQERAPEQKEEELPKTSHAEDADHQVSPVDGGGADSEEATAQEQRGDDPPSFPLLEALASAASRDGLLGVGATFAGQEASLHFQGRSDVQVHTRLDKVPDFSSASCCSPATPKGPFRSSVRQVTPSREREDESAVVSGVATLEKDGEREAFRQLEGETPLKTLKVELEEEIRVDFCREKSEDAGVVFSPGVSESVGVSPLAEEKKDSARVFAHSFEFGGGPGREEQGNHDEEVEGPPPGPEKISVRFSELTSDLPSSRSSSSLLPSSLSVRASNSASGLRVEVERAARETLRFASGGQEERGEEEREQREEEVERERGGKGERGADSSAEFSCQVHREEEGEGRNFGDDEGLPDRNEGTDSRERQQREETQGCLQSERCPGRPSHGRRHSDTEARRPEETLASPELDAPATGNDSQREERQDEEENLKKKASLGQDVCARGKSQEGERTELGMCGIQAASQPDDSEDRGIGNAQNFAVSAFQIFSSPQRSCCSRSPLHAATPLPFDVATPTPLREVNEEREEEEREESAREEQETRATGEEKDGGEEEVGDSRRSIESESEETGGSNSREEITSCPAYTIQTSPDLQVSPEETDDRHLSSSWESPSRPEKGVSGDDLVGSSASLTEATEDFFSLVSSGFLPCSFQPPTPSPAFLAALQDSPPAAADGSGAVSSSALPLPAPSPLVSPSCLHTQALERLGRGTDEGREESGEENGGGNTAEIDAEIDSENNAPNGGEGEKENRIEGVRSPRRSAAEPGRLRGPNDGAAFGAGVNPGEYMQVQASSGGEAERRESRGRTTSQGATRERRETAEGRSSAFRERGKNSSRGSDSESSRDREKRWRTERRDSTCSRAASAGLHRKKEEQEEEQEEREEEKDEECVETDLMSPKIAAGALTVSHICASLETRSSRQEDMSEGSASRQRDENGVSCDQDVRCLRETLGTDSTSPVPVSPASPFSIATRSASAANPSSDTSSSVRLPGPLLPTTSASVGGLCSSTSSDSVPRTASAPGLCSPLSSSAPSCCRPSAASSSAFSSLSSPLHLSGSARGTASAEQGCETPRPPYLSSPAKKRKGAEFPPSDSDTAKPSFGLRPSPASRSPLCSARGELERESANARGETASDWEAQAFQSPLTPVVFAASSEAAPHSPGEKREKERQTRALCEAPVLVLSDEEEESLGTRGVSPLAPRPSEDMTGASREEKAAQRLAGVRGEHAEETRGVEDVQGAVPERESDREERVEERKGDSTEEQSLERDADERREQKTAREERWTGLERNEPVEVEPALGVEEDKCGVGTALCENKSAKSPAKAERWHLSREDQKTLAALLQRLGRPRASDGEVLLHRAGIPLTVKSLRGLLPGGLLDDEVINLYMVLLQERSDRSVRRSQSGASSSPPLRCQFFPSHFYASLRKGGFDSVRRWTLRKKVDIFRQDVLIFPLHVVAETHWALGVVNFRDDTLEYYDSLDYQEEGREFGERIREYLRREHLDKKRRPFAAETRLKPLVKRVPCQENSSDCGVFCCQFAEHLGAARLAFDFTQADITSLRYKMMLQLCQTYVA
ncbi:Ulp1 protease family, C-terminal catalytic domain-containing protein [Toxoplasma gondii VEG]|uniref:Sentrin-specific protease 3 n=2 Tax=Toxoplasma gondii TaxID=5811 RepID=V4ZIJ3_TOXGV|nr:Ulp1 protease family, C-terminal catalytic domain-containing protein [Toxoplasma gondii VEG]KFG32732.1 Ulp1 protease family, C-terminal catalytic domain-containing protein [Toxoplasma gondii p89]CEL75758.1 TPA: Sentrin-specific protease 3 [Toxoplasma gondii VEG]